MTHVRPIPLLLSSVLLACGGGESVRPAPQALENHHTQYSAYAECARMTTVLYDTFVNDHGRQYADGWRCVLQEVLPGLAWNYHGDMHVDVYHDGVYRWIPTADVGYGLALDPLKGCGAAPRSCPLLVGNPIDAATGAKVQFEHDLLASTNGELELSRTYVGDDTPRPRGIFGEHWRSNYDRQLVQLSNSSPLTMIAYRQDGRGWYFSQAPDGSWRADVDTPVRLEAVAGGGWKLIDQADLEERYDASGRLLRIEMPGGDSRSLAYDSAGNLISVTSREGRVLTISYDGSGKAISVTAPSGASWTYSYAAELTGVTAPDGATRQYLYNEPGLVVQPPPGRFYLTGIVDERGARYATFGYDSLGRAILSSHDGDAERYELVYSGASQVQIKDPLGTVTTRSWQLRERAAKVTSVSGRSAEGGGLPAQVSYDAAGYPDLVTAFDGTVTDYDYDARGLVVKRVDAVGSSSARRTEQTTYHATFRAPIERRVLDAGGALVGLEQWTYNARGQLTSAAKVDPSTSVARTVTYTYCEAVDVTAGRCPVVGQLVQRDGERTDVADVTTYSYRSQDAAGCATSPTTCAYRKGDLWKVRDAAGFEREIVSYDGDGRPQRVRDPNGVVTDFERDARGQLVARKVRGLDDAVEADDLITRLERWPTGAVRRVVNADGSELRYEYDAAHRLTQVRDGEGSSISYTLNSLGQRVKEDTRDPLGTLRRTLTRTYDSLGQLRAETNAYGNSTTFSYDARGDLDTITDALGRVTDLDRDPLRRLTRVLQDPGGIAADTRIDNDALGHLRRVTDPKGLVTDYLHNGLGDLTQRQSPDTGATTYGPNSAGNKATRTDARGRTTTMTYDALGRLTGTAYPTAGLQITYGYDAAPPECQAGERSAAGRLGKITDASGTTSYCYDRLGNIARKVQTSNGRTFTVRYGYDERGRQASMTYPDGSVIDYVRDPFGKVLEIGLWSPGMPGRQVAVTEIAYHPFGSARQWAYANGRVLERKVDLAYRPQNVLDRSLGGLSLGYVYDEAGQLRELRDGELGLPAQRVFSYDRLGRLTESRDSAGALRYGYTYDKTGNRTSATRAGVTTTYSYSATSHRLSSVGTSLRAYDAAGNTTQLAGSARSLAYGDHGRVTQYRESGVLKMSYVYNGRGELVRRYASATDNTYSVYDEARRWLGDYDQNGQPIRQMIWLGDMPVGVLVGAGAAQRLYYIEPDALGSPRVVIDPQRGPAGVAVWRWDLAGEPFGQDAPTQDPDGDGQAFVLELRFPGQRYDSISGTTYNMFRTYDASTGRYLESDPLGQAAGLSTYGYVFGSPLMAYDRLGLYAWEAALLDRVIGAVVGCASGCAGSLLEDYGVCIAKKMWERRTTDPSQLLECSKECKPTACEFAKACFGSCVAGALVGFATGISGAPFSGIAGFFGHEMLTRFFEELFQLDVCQYFGLQPPENILSL